MGILSSIFGSGPKPVQTPFSQTSNGVNNSTFTGDTSGTQTAIAPDQYLPALLGMQPGQGGFSPGQQSSADWYSSMMGGTDPAGLGLSTIYFEDALKSRTAPTLNNLAASGNPAYAAPSPVSAQQVTASQGSKYMDSYRNPFEDQVVGSALADLENRYGKVLNSSNMQAAASGAFGGGRHGIRDAAVSDDYLRNVAATTGGLRAQGFNTAAGLGMQDANRFLQADSTNAANALSAATFNSGLTDSRQKFDANLGMQYNDQRDRTARDLANLGVTNLGVGQDLADGAFNMGATGQNQNLAWLQQFLPLFGQQNNQTQSGTESGTTTGNSSGYGTQVQPGWGGILGTVVDAAAAGAKASGGCWVAREVYGEENPRWLMFRAWLFSKAPAWFRKLYLSHGERVAVWLKDKPRTKAVIRSWMDSRISGRA